MKKKLNLIVLICISLIICFSIIAACSPAEETKNEKVILTWYYDSSSKSPLTIVVYNGDVQLSKMEMTKTGYTFLGLFDSREGGVQVVNAYGRNVIKITKSMTLYAQWMKKTYEIELELNGGNLLSGGDKVIPILYGDEVPDLPVAEKIGYDFVGWRNGEAMISDATGKIYEQYKVLNSPAYSLNEDKIKLEAVFKIKQVVVTFEFGNSIKTTMKTYDYGTKFDSIEMPEMDTGDMEIGAWSTSKYEYVAPTGIIDENTTLYAVWKYYRIIELYSESESKPQLVKVYQGEEYEFPVLDKQGFALEGWYTSPLFAGNPVEATTYYSTVNKFYAKWNLVTYSINFVTKTADELPEMTYTIESEFELPTVNKENYIFIGWKSNDKPDEIIKNIIPGTTGDMLLEAVFNGEEKGVVLNAGEGKISASTTQVEYGAHYKLEVPVYDGYEFQGWYLSEEDDAVCLTDKEGNSLNIWEYSDAETQIFAKYLLKVYVEVVCNKDNNASANVNEYYTVGQTVSLVAEIADGYSFEGWYKNGSKVSDVLTYVFSITEDVKLEIRVEAKIYNVDFDPNGGIYHVSTDEVVFDDEYAFSVPYKEGYTFLGWYFGEEEVTDASGKGKGVWHYTSDIVLVARYKEGSDGTIAVYDANSLKKIADNPAGSYFLIKDLDMLNIEWVPFDFKGNLEGNGFKIKNLSVSSDVGNIGMFLTNSGTIKNLTLENLSITSASINQVMIGGLCAVNTGTIDTVTVKGRVAGQYCRAGGIAGKQQGGKIINSNNYATVSVDTFESSISAGGITGWLSGGSIEKCKNYGAVSSDYHTGGIVGWAQNVNFVSSENHGAISGGDNVGGIAGLTELAGSYTINSYIVNYGVVSGVDNVGGIIGKLSDYLYTSAESTYILTIKNVSNYGAITGIDFVGGIIGYSKTYAEKPYWANSSYVKTIMQNLKNTGNITGETYVAGIAGYAYSNHGSSQISYCDISCLIKGKAYIGAVGGKLENIGISNSTNTGSEIVLTSYYISGSTIYAYLGGFVGSGVSVSDCVNEVEINNPYTGIYVGGIAGYIMCSITNCVNNKNVSSQGKCVGGIVGERGSINTNALSGCTNNGDVSGTVYVGGITGRIYCDVTLQYKDFFGNLSVTKMMNNGNINGTEYVGGIFGDIYVNVNTNNGMYETWMKVVGSEWDNRGKVSGTSIVGGLAGSVYTDNSSSSLTVCFSAGNVVAEKEYSQTIAKVTNFKINS